MILQERLGNSLILAIRNAVVQGLAAADAEIRSSQGYDTGIGLDHHARCRSRLVENALNQMCGLHKELGLVAKNRKSKGVNKLFIGKDGIDILAVQAPDRNGYLDEPLYQTDYRSGNPSKQIPLFDEISGEDCRTLFRVEYGLDKLGPFASITIPDSNGGLYASLDLDLSAALHSTKVAEEMIPQPKLGRKKKLRSSEA